MRLTTDRIPPRTETVDPNLLPPPPPPKKPPPTEVAVVCLLCGTRVWAPLAQVGQKIRCPDCFSENVVPPPPPVAASSGPTLADAPTFALSEEVQRPGYRPLVVPRGEDAILAAFEPPAASVQPAHPDEVRMELALSRADNDETELKLAPPEERLAVEPTLPVTLLQAEPEHSLYDGRYDDGLVDDRLDPRDPQAWRRAPLMRGIVGFLFKPDVWPRWVAYAVGLMFLEGFGRLVAWAAAGGSALALALIPLTLAAAALVVAGWVIPFAATVMAVIEGTGHNGDEISEWADWDFFQWFWPAFAMGTGLLVASIPGLALSTLFLAAGEGRLAAGDVDWPRLAIPVVLSWWLLGPPLVSSMLAEASLVRMISPLVLRSFSQVPDAWLLYYLEAVGVWLVLGLSVALLRAEGAILVPLGAVGTVGSVLVHARLLGRLIWYCRQRVDPTPEAG